MKKSISIILALLFIFIYGTYSQDTINLISGKQIFAKSIYEEPNSTLLKYDIRFHEKAKQKAVDLLNVYSIHYSNHTQKIFYKQDSAIGFDLTVKQMELNILGEREALKNYKAPWITVGGFVVGATATYFLGFWGVISPAVYATAFGIITPKIHTSPELSYATTSDFNFREGYKYTATRIKVKNAILGSIVGVAAYSLTSYTLYLINK